MVVSGMAMVLSSLMNKEEHKARVAMPYQKRLPTWATVPSKASSESWVTALSQSKSTANDKKARFSQSRFHPQNVRGCRRSAREIVAPFSFATASTLSFAICDTCTSTAPAILFLNGLVILPHVLGKGPCLPPVLLLPFFRPFFNSFPVLCQLEHDEVPVQVPTLRATPCPSARPFHRKRCHPSQTWPYQKMVTGRKIVWHMFSGLSAPVSRTKKGVEEAARDMMQNQRHVRAVPQSEKA